jgi:hypothetical protein
MALSKVAASNIDLQQMRCPKRLLGAFYMRDTRRYAACILIPTTRLQNTPKAVAPFVDLKARCENPLEEQSQAPPFRMYASGDAVNLKAGLIQVCGTQELYCVVDVYTAKVYQC